MAVRVRRVVIPIPTLPGTLSTGMKRDSQASTWRYMVIVITEEVILETISPQTQWRGYKFEQYGNQSDESDAAIEQEG